MNPILFQTTDWSTVPSTEQTGKSGFAKHQTVKLDKLRIRLVEYSKNYASDEWCKCGRLVYCLEGEFTSELSDGRIFTVSKGMSFQVSNNIISHRSYSSDGAKLLIIDGDFLKNDNTKIINPWRM